MRRKPWWQEPPSTDADLLAMLSDPVAVHLNMLRGKIAKPSVENILHLYKGEIIAAPSPSTDAEPVAFANGELIGDLGGRGMVVYNKSRGTYTTPLYTSPPHSQTYQQGIEDAAKVAFDRIKDWLVGCPMETRRDAPLDIAKAIRALTGPSALSASQKDKNDE